MNTGSEPGLARVCFTDLAENRATWFLFPGFIAAPSASLGGVTMLCLCRRGDAVSPTARRGSGTDWRPGRRRHTDQFLSLRTTFLSSYSLVGALEFSSVLRSAPPCPSCRSGLVVPVSGLWSTKKNKQDSTNHPHCLTSQVDPSWGLNADIISNLKKV